MSQDGLINSDTLARYKVFLKGMACFDVAGSPYKPLYLDPAESRPSGFAENRETASFAPRKNAVLRVMCL